MNMNAHHREIWKVTDRINELLYREEMMWLQWSRISWLKEGDRNTKYFQTRLVWRERKNIIKELKDGNGVPHSAMQALSKMVTEYFQTVYLMDPHLNASAYWT